MTTSGQSLIIGVDGGGTGCRAAIGTVEKGVLGRAEGGRANATSDLPLAIDSIINAVAQAADAAGVARAALVTATAHVGIAGVMGPNEANTLKAALPYKTIEVTDDRPTAVVGALGGKDGYLLAIGTGSIAGSSKNGIQKFLGGWGFIVSDHGSGAWLGRAVLEQVLFCQDGLAQHSALTRHVFTKFANDPNAIVTFCTKANPADFATLAPDVCACAKTGDAVGKAILSEGAAYLVRSLKGLGFKAGEVLCLTGGVGPHYAEYLPQDYLAGHVTPAGTSLDGAFALAGQLTD